MRVLTFSAYYTPELAASMYITEDIYESMVKAGNDVVLYAPTPTRGISNEMRKAYQKRKNETFLEDRLQVHRISMYREGKGTVGRALRYVLLNIAFIWKGLHTKADMIFVQSTPPTQGMMAALIKAMKHIPFIYNLQDIFPDSLVNTGIARQGGLLWRIGRKVENYTYRSADRIIVISEDFKKNIMAKGVPEDKIVVVPNWVDTAEVYSVERKNNKLFDKYDLDRSKFYICYSGNIGFTQNMDMLVDVAKALSAETNIGFVLVGDGADRERIAKRIQTEGIGNVTMIPFQPYEDISQVFSLGDVGLIISKAGIGANSVPSKTWSIMAAERPILASFDLDSELSYIIIDAGCGIVVQAGDQERFKTAVLNLYADRRKAAYIGKMGKKYLDENLSKEKCVAEYVNVMAGTYAGEYSNE